MTDSLDLPSRGIRLIAYAMVIIGGYGALTTLVSPIGPQQLPPLLWLASGLAALGTATAGIRLLQDRAGAVTFGIVTMSSWLLLMAAQAVILGIAAFANPVTVGRAVILAIALVALLRERAAATFA